MTRLLLMAGTVVGATILIMTVFMTTGNITAEVPVQRGFALWQEYGCESCHLIYGQGGNYAPDLTHIYTLRGEPYIRDFIVNPSAYHPNQRAMPRFTINQDEISDLIAMFEWTATTEPVADAWPPNPIQVSNPAGLNISAVTNLGAENQREPLIVQGETIYSQRCASCHSVTEGVLLVGPSFWNIANIASERVEGQSAETYIRNAILYPGEYIVPGFQNVMQKNFAEVLSSQDVDAVVAYLMTLDGESTE